MIRVVEFGVAHHRQCAGHEQAAQIAITLFAGAAEPLAAAARFLEDTAGVAGLPIGGVDVGSIAD